VNAFSRGESFVVERDMRLFNGVADPRVMPLATTLSFTIITPCRHLLIDFRCLITLAYVTPY